MNSKKTLAQKTELAKLSVWTECKIQRINEDTMKWETIGKTTYTPYHINEFLKANKLKSIWVNVLGNREMWFVGKGFLATH